MADSIALGVKHLFLNKPHANIDGTWGPYPSLLAALDTDTGIDAELRVKGFKFGVEDSENNSIKEYIFTDNLGTYKEVALVKEDLNISSDADDISYTRSGDSSISSVQDALDADKEELNNLEREVVKVDPEVEGNTTQFLRCGGVNDPEWDNITGNDVSLNVTNLDSFNEEHNSESLQNIVEKTDELLKNSVNVNVNSSTKTFAIKTSNNTTVGTIVVGEGAGGSATLTLNSSSNSGQPIVVTLPNLKYDSSRQVLQYVNALGQSVDTVRLSNLQIKKVLASAPLVDQEPPATADFTLGDLILVGPDANDNNSYELNVCTKADSDGQTGTEYLWASLGKITDVSLVADQVGLTSTKLNATNVKGGLEELSDKIENIQATVWSGYVGVTTNSIDDIDNVPLNSFKTYTNTSGLIDIEINSYSYIWFVIDNEIVVSCNNIEVPTEYVGNKNGKNYYKTKERIASSIKVELISTTNTQGEEGGGGGVTPSVEQPQIISQSSSPENAYDDGDTIDAIEVVVANPTDGGTLSFQWYQGGSPWGESGTISSVTEGIKSSLVPEANKTATYYCKITNTLNGYTSTIKTADIRIRFNSSSASDLSHFTEGKYINSSGNVVDNEDYYLSDWFDTGVENDTMVCVLFNFANGYPVIPPMAAQTRIGENGSITNLKSANGGRKYICGSNVQFRCVIPKSEIDYSFIYIGDTFKFKGSKVTDSLLLNVMGSFSGYFNKCFKDNGNNNVSIVNDKTSSGSTSPGNSTWITKPIELIVDKTYTINVGWTNYSSDLPPKWIVASELLTESGGTYVTCKTDSAAANSSYPNRNKVVGSATNKYLYCSCALKELKNCYVYYTDDNNNRVYVLKGGNV